MHRVLSATIWTSEPWFYSTCIRRVVYQTLFLSMVGHEGCKRSGGKERCTSFATSWSVFQLYNPGSLTNLWVVKLQMLRVCSTTSAARAIAPVPGQVVNSVTECLDLLVPKQKAPASSGPKVQHDKIEFSAVHDLLCSVSECIYSPTIYCVYVYMYIHTCIYILNISVCIYLCILRICTYCNCRTTILWLYISYVV